MKYFIQYTQGFPLLFVTFIHARGTNPRTSESALQTSLFICNFLLSSQIFAQRNVTLDKVTFHKLTINHYTADAFGLAKRLMFVSPLEMHTLDDQCALK